MKISSATPDPHICPLCHKPNSCLSVDAQNSHKTCWCHDPSIHFSAELLERIPAEKRRKACVCKACALAFMNKHRPEEP